ncbi:MAG: arsenite efflux transporter metallochaperone ArsD [Bacillota bacterium]|nr:arsenite efflux transporter metallochaperone ArsD [Bacillota bacterium]
MTKKLVEIFDPPMCCSTGVCGPSVDPVLVKVNETVMKLKKEHAEQVEVERHMLTTAIQAFQKYPEVIDEINSKGKNALPIVTIDGKIIKSGEYASFAEIVAALGI